MWTVGGIAPGGTAVNNGLGQLIRSGTNVRLFRTTFPTATAKPEEEIDKHEARLAVALGMDRTQRVLETNVIHHHTENARSKPRGVLTQWNGSEWVTEGTLPSELLKNRSVYSNRSADIDRAQTAARKQGPPYRTFQVSPAKYFQGA